MNTGIKKFYDVFPVENSTSTFLQELETLINRYSKENDSDTPDFILAKYLNACLENYSETVKARDKWFGVDMWEEDYKIKS